MRFIKATKPGVGPHPHDPADRVKHSAHSSLRRSRPARGRRVGVRRRHYSLDSTPILDPANQARSVPPTAHGMASPAAETRTARAHFKPAVSRLNARLRFSPSNHMP
ncbi:hypothetical protein PR202_ga24796 [Eleusine coracana subsp. coracana]|uniref:Uncharacterized protein n=1 Tax=Eleusine coracana subsp. coracana TaxID=191504 RepID=A0AAV5D9E0_ELECO|nr:hypothetical protein PR202_ga24796 [Eleusine coracana subsp. coracana]